MATHMTFRTAPAALTVLLVAATSVACAADPEPNTEVAFEVRGVVAEVDSATAAPQREGTIVRADAPGSEGEGGLELGVVFVFAHHVDEATAVSDGDESWSVEVTLNAEGDAKLRTLTGLAACESEEARTGRIAVLVDDEVVASPEITVPCGSEMGSPLTIDGGFSEEEATELADSLG